MAGSSEANTQNKRKRSHHDANLEEDEVQNEPAPKRSKASQLATTGKDSADKNVRKKGIKPTATPFSAEQDLQKSVSSGEKPRLRATARSQPSSRQLNDGLGKPKTGSKNGKSPVKGRQTSGSGASKSGRTTRSQAGNAAIEEPAPTSKGKRKRAEKQERPVEESGEAQGTTRKKTKKSNQGRHSLLVELLVAYTFLRVCLPADSILRF